MDYLIVSLITVTCVIILMNKLNNLNNLSNNINYEQTKTKQSNSLITNKPNKQILKTQSIKFLQAKMRKVLFMNNEAFWIKNNTVYKARANKNKIYENTIEIVDTMGMNRVELDKIMFIVEKLTEGNDDSSNTGH